MSLIRCPYCHSQGLVVNMKTIPGGFEVSRKCLACGYVCDSTYTPAEMPPEGLGEFDYLERRAQPQTVQRGLRGSKRLAARLREAGLSFDSTPEFSVARVNQAQR
jgi:hypothetical protein